MQEIDKEIPPFGNPQSKFEPLNDVVFQVTDEHIEFRHYKSGQIHIHFKSLREILEYIEKHRQDFLTKICRPGHYHSVLEDPKSNYYNIREDFQGVKSYKEAENLILEGWSESDKILEQEFEAIDILFKTLKSSDIYYRTEGVDFDLGRILTGDPEYWMRPEELYLSTKGKTCKLLINASISWSTPKKLIYRNGIRCLMFVDFLERLGVITSLWVGEGVSTWHSTRENIKHLSIRIKLKDFGELYSYKDVAFCFGHPALLRVFLFSLEDIFGLYNKEYHECFGNPGSHGVVSNFYQERETDNFDFVFNISEFNFGNCSKLLEWYGVPKEAIEKFSEIDKQIEIEFKSLSFKDDYEY